MDGNILNRVFCGRSGDATIQFFRYICSGGIAFAVDKFLFVLTHYYTLHLDKYASTTIGFCAGLVITYTLSRVWIFNERRLKNSIVELLIFSAIGGIGLLLMNFFVWLFSDPLSIQNVFFCNILSTGIVTIWNFVAKKYILFTKK